MKKHLTWVMALVILLSQAGCKRGGSAPTELLDPAGVKMDTARVQLGELSEIAAYQGEVLPYVEALSFPEDGYLEEIKVFVGDTVSEGQVLAATNEGQLLGQIEGLKEEIDNIRRQGEFSDRQASIDIEIAMEELAILTEEEETESLTQKSREKEAEIQRRKLQLRQAQEMRALQLSEKQKNLEELRRKAGRNQITAPFSGRIVYVAQIKAGNAVQAGEPIFYLADESRLHIETEHIPEPNIKNADKIYAKIMDKEYALTYQPYDADVYAAMVAAGEDIPTQFSIEAGESVPESGQFAAVMLRSFCREDVLTIPVNALYQEEGGWYVYRVDEERRVRCDVTVGLITDTKAEIVEGLKEGDVIYVRE